MSKKPEEIALMRLVLESGGRIHMDKWDALTKQDYVYLEKWEGKGYWESGVSTRSGWLTDEGKKAFHALCELKEE